MLHNIFQRKIPLYSRKLLFYIQSRKKISFSVIQNAVLARILLNNPILSKLNISTNWNAFNSWRRTNRPIEKKKEEIPVFQEQIHSLKGELSLLASILNGLERAQREMER
jgi:hypothetical protein